MLIHVNFLGFPAAAFSLLPVVETFMWIVTGAITFLPFIGDAFCACAFAAHVLPKPARRTPVPVGVLVDLLPSVALEVCGHVGSDGHQLWEGTTGSALMRCYRIPHLIII